METEKHLERVVTFYDTHPINLTQILTKAGVDENSSLTVEALKEFDQDHYGGTDTLDLLAERLNISPDSRVLDVGCGVGGPARYLVWKYGCRVWGVDLTESRIEAANALSKKVGLSHLLCFDVGDACSLPYTDRKFDTILSQEAFCHIPDKRQVVAECARVCEEKGRFGFTDIVVLKSLSKDEEQKLLDGLSVIGLETLQGYQHILRDSGFVIESSEDLTESWVEILSNRLEMYRGLKEQTVSKFGLEHFKKWDDVYQFFVGLFKKGKLGGFRGIMSKNAI